MAGRGARPRGDGFDEERKLLFLAALRDGQGVLGACRLVGVSNRTAYNHRRDDPDFERAWALALRMATLPLELVAFERAVAGVEEPVFAYGKLRGVRVRRSDRLLVALLGAQKPEKFGRTAGARAQGKLVRKLKRMSARLKALEARLEGTDLQTVRSAGAVNFVNHPPTTAAAARRRPRGGERAPASRLATARRRAAAAGISIFPGKP